MSSKLKRSLSAAMVGAVLACGVPHPAALGAEISGGVVKIGVINDQTGFLADPTGKGSVVATQMAVEDFKR